MPWTKFYPGCGICKSGKIEAAYPWCQLYNSHGVYWCKGFSSKEGWASNQAGHLGKRGKKRGGKGEKSEGLVELGTLHWLGSPRDDQNSAGTETSPHGGIRINISIPLHVGGCGMSAATARKAVPDVFPFYPAPVLPNTPNHVPSLIPISIIIPSLKFFLLVFQSQKQ